ncbi:helicase MOV-10-like [Sitodiplosis mosellana]|uniref:helicase MOV-10-like n=1 Tax=Sitodiplosis mosellana TaxID=263140 RepID=UPI00244409A6|nr:helicase MOV-10-like [Sitodiplosis mosellana]
MYRMYAKSYDHRKISKTMKPICNWAKSEFHFPSLKYLYHFRVLICTLTTAGCLARAREAHYYSSSHFSHIFIDEGASTHETVSMIPIAGLCTSRNQVHSSVVLAGDPKQLDAVTKSENAVKLGFKTSFLEQLFNRKLYERNPLTGQYNRRYITQLVKNYRSHPAILAIPNALFYENKLEAKASLDTTNWFIGSKLLPCKSFPIIFKSVQGLC